MILFLYLGLGIRFSYFKEYEYPNNYGIEINNNSIPNFMVHNINNRLLVHHFGIKTQQIKDINYNILENELRLISAQEELSLNEQNLSNFFTSQNRKLFLQRVFLAKIEEGNNIITVLNTDFNIEEVLGINLKSDTEYDQTILLTSGKEGTQNIQKKKIKNTKEKALLYEKLIIINALYTAICNIPLTITQEPFSAYLKSGVYTPDTKIIHDINTGHNGLDKLDKNKNEDPKYLFSKPDNSIQQSDVFQNFFKIFYKEHIYIEPKIFFMIEVQSEQTKKDGLRLKKIPLTGVHYIFEIGLPFGFAQKVQLSSFFNQLKNTKEIINFWNNTKSLFKNTLIYIKYLYNYVLNKFRKTVDKSEIIYYKYDGFPANISNYIGDLYKGTFLRFLTATIGARIFCFGINAYLDFDRIFMSIFMILQHLFSNIKYVKSYLEYFEHLYHFIYALGLSVHVGGFLLITISYDFVLGCLVISIIIMHQIYRNKPKENSVIYGITEESSQQYSEISKDMISQ